MTLLDLAGNKRCPYCQAYGPKKTEDHVLGCIANPHKWYVDVDLKQPSLTEANCIMGNYMIESPKPGNYIFSHPVGYPGDNGSGGAAAPAKQLSAEPVRPRIKKEKLNVVLDPSKTSKDSESLEYGLKRLVVGQDEAINNIVSVYQTWMTGMNQPGRPVSNLLFLGPTGTGKTRIVEATAETLVRNPKAVIKIDCAEFQHSHEIAKLIGSPPGYLGHRETHPVLSQEALNQYHTEKVKLSFVLFDEIEKASDALWNLLLGILDKAILTLGDNRKVDFSKAMIFMTSNLGAREMASLMSPGIGFATPEAKEIAKSGKIDAKTISKIAKTGTEAAKRKFTPEFYNRLDKVVTFRSLGEEELRKILDIELNLVQQRILSSNPEKAFVFTLSMVSKDFLLREGIDVKYGARHLKRTVEKRLVQPLSNLIATNQVRGGDWVKIDLDSKENELSFVRVTEGLLMEDMAKIAL